MAGYMRELWKYSQRTGNKVAIKDLAVDPVTNMWMEREETDPPRFTLRVLGPDRMHLEPPVPGEPVTTYTTISGPFALATSTSGFTSTAVRVVLPAVAAASTYLRVTLQAPVNSAIAIGSAYVGILGSGFAYASAPLKLTRNMCPAFVIDKAAQIVLDAVYLSVAVGQQVMVSYDVRSDIVAQQAVTGITTYTKANAAEAYIQSPSGYSTTANTVTGITTLETDVTDAPNTLLSQIPPITVSMGAS